MPRVISREEVDRQRADATVRRALEGQTAGATAVHDMAMAGAADAVPFNGYMDETGTFVAYFLLGESGLGEEGLA